MKISEVLIFIFFEMSLGDVIQSEAPVVKFFHGEKDPLGRTHDEMMSYSFERMEECHDYVQWMWPLHEPSAFAVVFPVLTEAQAAILQASPEARNRMNASLKRFRQFYGLPSSTQKECNSSEIRQNCNACGTESEGRSVMNSSSEAGEGGVAQKGWRAGEEMSDGAESKLPPGFSEERAGMWCMEGDHNNLRITRIIRSLRLFGLEVEAASFYSDALTVANWARLGPRTIKFWKKAAEDEVWRSLRG